jgi:large subunit ribosomal protein L21
MTIYAVMKTGGKEYRVAPGDVVRVEKLEAGPGTTVEIREVCLIAIGQDVTVGSPTVADARVVAEVIEEGRGEKIVSFKKKRRNRYQMTIDDAQSYTILRIREIAAGKSVYAAGAPPPEVVAETAPPSPPRIPNPGRKVPEPQTRKHLQPLTPPPPAPIELPLPVEVHGDAPVAPKVASEDRVGTQPQTPKPSSHAVHPVHGVESAPSAPSSTEIPPARMDAAAPAPALEERGPRKRSYGIAALVVTLLAIAAGLLVWGTGQPRVSMEAAVEVEPVAATPQAAPPSLPEPAAKAPPRKETAIKNPAAASAPSAPVQPPE